MRRRLATATLATLAGLALASCGSGAVTPPGATPAPGAITAAAAPARPFVVEHVASYRQPWAMTFLSRTQLLITLQSGELLLRDVVTGVDTPVTGTPQVAFAGQGGLGDVVAGPTFATDKVVYLSWAEASDDGTSGAVVGRAVLETSGGAARLIGLKPLWRQQPTVTGSGHYGHRLAFSPDGRYLFVSSGERQKFDPAQDLGVNLGKTVRLNLDGTPAAGNPFADRGGVSAEIWSYGHRNPLGLAFDGAGRLWSTEMGPQGGDELNLIEPGKNYGWPKVSNGSHYGGAGIPDHAPGDGFEAPKVWWNPSISPGSLMIYGGEAFGAWQGDAFIGALSGEALIRVDLDATSAAKADQWDLGQRIREVEQAPDGSIWLLEDDPGGRLLRLSPP
ncbi:MAG: PQQ-dependent sugar dehydrogenase [Propionicimonas sp.]